MKKKDLWIRIGCLLTGYEEPLLAECSANSRATVSRYFSALIVLCCIWAFIGYSFATRYLNLGIVGGIAAGLIMVIVAIQVERQIILSFKPNWKVAAFRVLIAFLMAGIGSVIIDQIILKEDIANLQANNRDFNNALLKHFADINLQDSLKKNRLLAGNVALEKQDSLLEQSFKNENASARQSSITTMDTNKNVITRTRYQTNAKLQMIRSQIAFNGGVIKENNIQINAMDDSIQAKRKELTHNLKPDKKGFLNEIDLLFTFIFIESNSKLPMIVWLFFVCFFLGIELFILFTKSHKDKNDYELLVLFQEKRHKMEIEEYLRAQEEKIEIQKKKPSDPAA